MLVAIYPNDHHIATSGRPRNRRDWQGNRDVKGRPFRSARRATYLKMMTNSEGLITGRAGNQKRTAVFIINSKFDLVFLVRLVPADFNKPSDSEWLRVRTNLSPRTAQKEEEGYSDFGAICQENLRSHFLLRLIPPAQSQVVAPVGLDRLRK